MKRMRQAALALLCLARVAHAQVPLDVQADPSCVHCGMDRQKFAHSRMLIEYDDGSRVGLCSIRCAAVELAIAIDKTPKAILVADEATKKLVDAEKAIWVIGGTVQGVMTKRAKWAFEDRTAADAFIKTNGGAIATFDEAVKSAYEDLYQDTKLIREKRRSKRTRATGAPAAAMQPSGTQP